MKKLYDAFEKITPNRFNEIQTELKSRDDEITVEVKPKKHYLRYALPVLALSAVMVFALLLPKTSKAIATVGLDVNPSIAFDLDKDYVILNVKAQNQDGEKILGNMKLEGNDLEAGMNAIIGAMLKGGYIDELKNSLLISVAGENEAENEKIRKELSLNIDALLKEKHIEGSIVSQTIQDNAKLEKLASQYGISIGKAELIQELIKKNKLYTFEGLKDLNVNDLNILLQKNSVETINVNGQASEKGYIGKEKAKQIATQDANVSNPTFKQVELDYDDGTMVYEVEFSKNQTSYEYDIDATNGKILKKEKEVHKNDHDDDRQPTTSSTTSSPISESQAKSIAMKNAGVSSVSQYHFKKDDDDDGQMEYEIEFVSGDYKYEYTILANGKIKDKEKEFVGTVKITKEQAKQTALSHAQVSASQVKDLDVDLENKYYEVSFDADGYEYEYKIDANNGSIINHTKEKDD